jgi:probable HAF family extracellular repeat protein
MHDLGNFGGRFTRANAINNLGQIVGQSSLPTGQTHAFSYDGTMHDLGTSRAGGTAANDINDAGVIVGSVEVPEPSTLVLLASAFGLLAGMSRVKLKNTPSRSGRVRSGCATYAVL